MVFCTVHLPTEFDSIDKHKRKGDFTGMCLCLSQFESTHEDHERIFTRGSMAGCVSTLRTYSSESENNEALVSWYLKVNSAKNQQNS